MEWWEKIDRDEAERAREDLNEMRIRTDGNDRDPQRDFSAPFGQVTVHFKRLPDALISYLCQFEFAFGCVAWLTHEPILDALSRLKQATIIVQKEDFLRPDVGGPSKSKLRALYEAVRGSNRMFFSSLSRMSSSGDPEMDGVRCVGMVDPGSRSVPRMHHKFVVFCDAVFSLSAEMPRYVAKAVWTGSFNWTNNGRRSLENAVFIRDEGVAASYLKEFEQVACLSEPLDWENEYANPEWRDGT